MSKWDEERARLGTGHRASAIDDPERGASWGALWNAGFWDDPQKRMEEFRKARPGVESRLDPETGKPSYRDPKTGEWYLEETSGIWPTIKQLSAEAVSPSGGVPAVGGILGGLAGGPFGAVVGSMLGEGAYETVQSRLGEPLDVSSLSDIGLAGLGAGLGEAGGAALSGLGRLGKRVWEGPAIGGLRQRMGLTSSPFDEAAAQRLQQQASEVGVDLTAPELTGDRQQMIAQQWLTDRTETSSRMGQFLENREDQLRNAIEGYLGSLGGYSSPMIGERRAAVMANAARDQYIDQRRAAARPLYEAARGDKADISSTLDLIDTRMRDYPETSKIVDALSRVERLMMETPPSGLFGEADDVQPLMPTTSVGKLHEAKTTIDDMIESAKRTGDNNLARELIGVQESLLKNLEAGSGAYQQARQVYREESLPINVLDESVLGGAIGRESDPTYRISREIFGARSDPQQVAYARQMISENSPEAWNSVVRSHLQSAYDEVLDPASGDITNIGGMFRKKVFGNPRMREQLQAALDGGQYARLENLMDVLQATGASLKGQSATEIRQAMARQVEDQSRGVIGAMVAPRESYIRQQMRERTQKTMDKLLDATLSPTSDAGKTAFTLDQAARVIKRYGPRELMRRPKLLMAVSDALGVLGLQAALPERVGEGD